METIPADHPLWRCRFCRMSTGIRLFGIPVCPICQDQLQDFVWVSLIQGVCALIGWVNGIQFLVEEVALFGVLVLVKHRLPSVFDRFVRRG